MLSPFETRRQSRFATWARTGFWLPEQRANPTLEVKFNPYHDATNGQFTFGPGGASGGAAMARSPKLPRQQPGQEDPRMRAIDRQVQAKIKAANSRDPSNYTIYKVQPDDTLTHIAAKRTGLTSNDIKWLNALPSDRIKAGQEIKLPTQAHLDEGKRAFETFQALSAYIEAHGGQLPPDVAHPPALVEQAYGPGSRAVMKNGYTFNLDPLRRSRGVYGELSIGRDITRSRKNQADAGVPDRHRTDDGGHFIASRFNGPSDAFNHFAQNRNFNRGTYRALEDRWAKELKVGRRVSVNITAFYTGTSRRPDRLNVTWSINGQRHLQKFNNAPEGK